ncbi:TolC family protein [Desulfovibrio aerotolerans]|uniref:TolC family protein n=1 Tax=Solidesulfovibrio aerotolerans TaxID=295255 RepID=A0A7C9IV42_9BACT|nr:TolC family protein [Solidesulfovibrio aerotolerans]MYL82302.1 TolC family protein [Solidesulfovibrio aerotolerans]
MARKLSYRQGMPASGGDVSGRAFAAVLLRIGALALVCTVVLGAALPAVAAPGDRYTKDKVKGASTGTAETPKPFSAAAPAAAPAAAGDDPAPSFSKAAGGVALGATVLKNPADFNECVRVALAQSPLLTKSSIEIESKRLDVGDAYSQYIPTIIMSTTFYLRLPEYENTAAASTWSNVLSNASSNPAQNLSNSVSAANAIYAGNSLNRDRKKYDLSFSTGAWNPLLTAFDVQAKKEMVNIAVLSHLKVIDQGLKRLGFTYLQIGMVDSVIRMAKEKEDLAQKNLEYVKTRAGLGQGAQLDVRIAETKINLSRAEAEKMRTTKSVLLDELKFILGVPFVQKVEVATNDVARQVLEDFSPASVTDERLKKHSFQLRILEYEKALQKKSIALSYIHFLPTFSFGFTSVSTLSNNNYKDDTSSLPFMYPNLTLNMPFDWWTKGRDVSRQYKKMAQLNVEGRNLEFSLMSQFQQSLAKLRAAVSEVKFAESQVELQKLTVQQAQFRFDAGQVEYDSIVAAMTAYLDSKQALIGKQYERDSAMLEVRSLCGDFQDRYINATVMENI